jgi:hypothetical protein
MAVKKKSSKGMDLFGSSSKKIIKKKLVKRKKEVASIKEETPKKRRGRKPVGKFEPAKSTRALAPSERETQAGLEKVVAIDKKVASKPSFLDFKKQEFLNEIEEKINETVKASSHTITSPSQNSVEIRRDKDGNLAFTVKYYGRDIGDTVLGALAMLSRVDYNLREYEREWKKENQSGGTSVKGRNVK